MDYFPKILIRELAWQMFPQNDQPGSNHYLASCLHRSLLILQDNE